MSKTLKQALSSEPLRPTAAFTESVDEALDRLPTRNTKTIRPSRRLAAALCVALVLCALPLGYRALAPRGRPLARPDPVISPMPETQPAGMIAALHSGTEITVTGDYDPFSPLSMDEPFIAAQPLAVPMPQITEPDDAIPMLRVTEGDTAIPIPTLPPAPAQTSRDPDYAFRMSCLFYQSEQGRILSPFRAPVGDQLLILDEMTAQFGQLKFRMSTDQRQRVFDTKLLNVYINGLPVTAEFPIQARVVEGGNAIYKVAGEDGTLSTVIRYPASFVCIAPEVDYLRNGGRHLISAVFEQNGQLAMISVNLNARSGKVLDMPDESNADSYGLTELSKMLQENNDGRPAMYYAVPTDGSAGESLRVISMRHSWGKLAVKVRMSDGSGIVGGQLTLDDAALYLLSIQQDSDTDYTLNFFTDEKPGAYEGATVDLMVNGTEGNASIAGFGVMFEIPTSVAD